MRPRTSLLLAAGGLAVVGFIAASLGRREARPQDTDLRRSTYLTGPEGARAWADALELLGVSVDRFRRRTTALPVPAAQELLAVLAPAAPLTTLDGIRLNAWQREGGSVLAAGAGAAAYYACFHLEAQERFRASAQLSGDSIAVHAILAPATTDESPGIPGGGRASGARCDAGGYQADTLLATTSGEPVALRIIPDSGGVVLLVADGELFSNRAIRESKAGEFALGLVAGTYSHVLVDEYHQGFGPGGSMFRAARRWLASAPAGWVILQLFVVGAIGVLIGAVRFGPARHVIERRRRSPLEHVHALATALAAAGGHDVAVSLVIRGLRRRLARPGEPVTGSGTQWLQSLPARTRTPEGRDAAERLITLTRGRADAHSVREAANAVEDVWQDLTP
jgi:hypothetical protein